MVVQYAAEWNGVFLSVEEFAERNVILDELLQKNGRNPSEVRRSLMSGCWFGKDDTAVNNILSSRNLTMDDAIARGLVVGTGSQIVAQLGTFAEAGVQRIMLQWLDLEDLDGLEMMAKAVLPQV